VVDAIYNIHMKRQPSSKRRATLSDSADDQYVTSQIDPRRRSRKKPVEYRDSPVTDDESTWDREGAELEIAGPHPRR
jgi:hypothetical protein